MLLTGRACCKSSPTCICLSWCLASCVPGVCTGLLTHPLTPYRFQLCTFCGSRQVVVRAWLGGWVGGAWGCCVAGWLVVGGWLCDQCHCFLLFAGNETLRHQREIQRIYLITYPKTLSKGGELKLSGCRKRKSLIESLLVVFFTSQYYKYGLVTAILNIKHYELVASQASLQASSQSLKINQQKSILPVLLVRVPSTRCYLVPAVV
jgi:hypothetical protein